TITSSDINNGATGCGLDTLIVTRTYTITDGLMNSATCVQIFKVVDDVQPVLTCPANITIQCTVPPIPANTGGNATATDNCDATPAISYTDATVAGACPQERTITRTWLATDDCGNTGTCVQIIVVDDSVAPTITCPANITIQCTANTRSASPRARV